MYLALTDRERFPEVFVEGNGIGHESCPTCIGKLIFAKSRAEYRNFSQRDLEICNSSLRILVGEISLYA